LLVGLGKGGFRLREADFFLRSKFPCSKDRFSRLLVRAAFLRKNLKNGRASDPLSVHSAKSRAEEPKF